MQRLIALRKAILPILTCLITVAGSSVAEVTFSQDVAPILYKRCVNCHRPNDIAPMSFVTYQQARPWAKAIREAVLTRRMPPWHADPAHGAFVNDPRLSEAEIEVIRAWVGAGAPEGNPRQLPPAPEISSDWRIGAPDVIFPIPEEHVIAADGPDEYVDFLDIPTHFDHDVWISAVQLRPGNNKVVHHAHVFVDPPKTKSSESSNNPGVWERFSYKDQGLLFVKADAPVVNDGCREFGEGAFIGERPREQRHVFTTYVPGKDPEVYPEGFAKLIPAGSTVGFEIHYAKVTGKRETDRTQVGFRFARKPPQRILRRLDVDNVLFRILPGEPNQDVTSCYNFDQEVRLLSYTAHMHVRGKDMRFELMRPDGVKETLVFIPRYDFNWQIEYKVQDPVPVPKGSRLIITAHFDNSPNNRSNPDPSKTIRWGMPTSSEMASGWLDYFVPGEPPPVQQAATKGPPSQP
jgi:hypothetical protein